MEKTVYHIVVPEYWDKYKDFDYYRSPTFVEEKFIHLSKKEQVEGTLNRYFTDQEKILLLHIDTAKLSAELIYESATNQELFPHLYGKLNKSAIVNVEELSRGENGFFKY